MTYLPQMAFKNLARYRRRTMITASAIAYGLMMFIVIRSMLIGVDRESERNLWWYETGKARILAPGYWEERETFPLEKSFSLDRITPVLDEKAVPWASRISFGGDLIFYKDPFPEDGYIPSRFIAIDPRRDSQVFRLEETLGEGRWLTDGEQGLLMGRWLAEDIGAKVGYTVLVETRTKDGFPQLFDLTVVGILDSPNPIVSGNGLYLPLSVAAEYLEMNGTVTELSLDLPDGQAGENLFAELVSPVKQAGLEILDWKILGEDFVAVSRGKQAGTGAIIFLILIIAAVGISNTMLMAVYERVRELGMMRALGMKDSTVRGLFLWESAGIGMIGGLLGVILGAAVNVLLVRWGLDYTPLMREGSNFGYRFQGMLYGVWDVPSFLIAFALGVGMSVFVALFSTQRILHLDIPSCIRHQ